MAQKIHAGSGMWRNISDREMKAMREKEARSVQKLLHTLYNTESDIAPFRCREHAARTRI